jgi:hypothetical protein
MRFLLRRFFVVQIFFSSSMYGGGGALAPEGVSKTEHNDAQIVHQTAHSMLRWNHQIDVAIGKGIYVDC